MRQGNVGRGDGVWAREGRGLHDRAGAVAEELALTSLVPDFPWSRASG